MHQATPESALQGNHVRGSGSLQARRPGGEPLQVTRTSVGRPKKRERNETVSDPVKQQRIDKSGSHTEERPESQKAEAPSLVGKDGGLSSVASVDRLVCIMTYEWNESIQRPIDLMVSRTMLAKVVAATVELDCLFRFLKLGGLSVLDRWLQEMYMSKPSGEREGSLEGDRATDDLLCALLAALERLPVDLVALKTCSIGKTVNFLRGHRHPDIQRRARKLVDTWRKRVESEMEVSEGARSLVEQSALPQEAETKASAHVQVAGYPHHPALNECSGGGRGKYASVASICSSPESLSKVSTVTIPTTCSVETSSKSPITALKPSAEGPRLGFNSAPQHTYGGPQISEDGRPVSSACASGPINNQMRAAGKNLGGSKHRKSSNLSISHTSPAATVLSGSVIASKDYPEQGSVIHRSMRVASISSAAEVCNLPCCSFFQSNSVVSDRPSRSTLNSASSCVADCKERVSYPSFNQQQIGSEPLKMGIQLLASIAASENSTVDVKSPDSPSIRSVGPQRANNLQVETKIFAEYIMKNQGTQLQKMGGKPQEREHYDRNSSTVSSPETSTYDAHMCELKRVSAVYRNAHSPADTTSETSLPSQMSKDAGRKRGACTASILKDHRITQAVCEKSKKACLESAIAVEAVGDSSIAMPEAGLERKASTETLCLPTCSEDGCLEAGREIAEESGQAGLPCMPRRPSFDGKPTCQVLLVEGETPDGSALADSKLDSANTLPSSTGAISMVGVSLRNSPLGMHASYADTYGKSIEQKCTNQVFSVAKEIQRPVFDLNEMLTGGEESSVQAASNVGRPMQSFSLPASDALPCLPVVPMTPIAVVAAVNGGPFTLPAIACCRSSTGEPGWKGSAATSAFRPTQPRRSLDKNTSTVPEQIASGKVALDFDLNIAADSSACGFEKVGSADVKASCVDLKVASIQSAMEMTASLSISRKACESARVSLDLNQADEVGVENGTKVDFDLNNGPIVQDNDDVVLAVKHIRSKDPLPSPHLASASRLPIQSLSPITPILMPAYAMPHSDIPYPASGAMPITSGSMPWVNGRPHDGLLQYNIFMQNPSAFTSSALACTPTSSMARGPFQAIPFGISSASIHGFSASCGEVLTAPQLPSHLANADSLVDSHSKSSHVMGMLADAVHQQGMAGFWNRPNLDLNAGPDIIEPINAKDDRRHMRVMNEPMRARSQVMDMAVALQQREQEHAAMAGSMQLVPPLKQSIWR